MTDEVSGDDKEFSDAFAEMAGKKAAVADADAPVVAGNDGDDGDDGGGDTGDDAGGTGQADNGGDQDPYAGLPEQFVTELRSLKEKNGQLEHRINSDSGRVAAYQRQVSTLNDQLQAAINSGQRVAESAGTAGDKPSTADVAEAMQDEDSWAEFVQEYPEIAKAIESRLAKATGDFEKHVAQRLQPVEDLRHEADIQKGYEYLDSAYVGWKQRVGLYDAAGKPIGPTPEYQEWIKRQRPEVQAWADSTRVEDAESLIQLYDTHLLATGQMSKFKTAGASPQGEDNGKADALARKREQQLQDGDAINSRGAGVDVNGDGPDGEFDSAFTAFAKRRERERQRA